MRNANRRGPISRGPKELGDFSLARVTVANRFRRLKIGMSLRKTGARTALSYNRLARATGMPVTPEQIRRRLESLPQRFMQGLEFVQLSRMTRKKQSFPCYGMQWGAALYLYPLEKSLEEIFYSPTASQCIE